MYSAPTARIHTAGVLSPPILLGKGTWQGCPLSPLLFNIALQPLSRFLDGTHDLSGIQVGDVLKTALFAGDILFTSSPQRDIEYLQTVFNTYQTFSGLLINFSKSEILPLPTSGARIVLFG